MESSNVLNHSPLNNNQEKYKGQKDLTNPETHSQNIYADLVEEKNHEDSKPRQIGKLSKITQALELINGELNFLKFKLQTEQKYDSFCEKFFDLNIGQQGPEITFLQNLQILRSSQNKFYFCSENKCLQNCLIGFGTLGLYFLFYGCYYATKRNYSKTCCTKDSILEIYEKYDAFCEDQ